MQPTPDVDELILVDVRKYGLDRFSPWWQQVYFRLIYLPFVRWSHRWFRIPALGSLDADGRYSWVEPVCIATDDAVADAACLDNFYCKRLVPVNSSLPRESVHYKAHVYSKSNDPLRWAERSFPAAIPNSALTKALAQVTEAHEVVDRMLAHKRVGAQGRSSPI